MHGGQVVPCVEGGLPTSPRRADHPITLSPQFLHCNTLLLLNTLLYLHISQELGRSLGQNYDAVIGSLPKGLTHDERLRIRESMPMSPIAGALQQIPEVCVVGDVCVCVYVLDVLQRVSWLSGVRACFLRVPTCASATSS